MKKVTRSRIPLLRILSLLFALSATSTASIASGQVVISEIMAVNWATLDDDEGDSSDWIELTNLSSQTINLAGWYLTDNPDQPTLWQFPTFRIEPGDEAIVFASTKDRVSAGGQVHTNFSLSGDGEYLALIEPDGVTVAFSFGEDGYPEQPVDASYGIARMYQAFRSDSNANMRVFREAAAAIKKMRFDAYLTQGTQGQYSRTR